MRGTHAFKRANKNDMSAQALKGRCIRCSVAEDLNLTLSCTYL